MSWNLWVFLKFYNASPFPLLSHLYSHNWRQKCRNKGGHKVKAFCQLNSPMYILCMEWGFRCLIFKLVYGKYPEDTMDREDLQPALAHRVLRSPGFLGYYNIFLFHLLLVTQYTTHNTHYNIKLWEYIAEDTKLIHVSWLVLTEL